MIPRRAEKIKIFLSVVIPVVKAAFMLFSAIGGNPANAGVTRICGVSPHPIPDTATALPNHAFYQLNYTRIFIFLPLYHGEEKNKDYSVRARFYGQSRFCSALGSQSKSRKHSHRKAFRRFVLPCSGYRHGALKRSALSIGLPLILRIRRPHPGGVFTISAFQMFCNRKISSPEPP